MVNNKSFAFRYAQLVRARLCTPRHGSSAPRIPKCSRNEWRGEKWIIEHRTQMCAVRKRDLFRLLCRRNDGVRASARRVRRLTGGINKKGVNEIDRDRGIRLYETYG